MRGKTNVYNLYFSEIINTNISNEILLESNFTTSNGLTYQYYKDSEDNWELVILTSGTITFNKNLNADIWAVGGGKNGGVGKRYDYGNADGGKGGNGGQCVYTQISISANTPYQIVIGDNSNNTTGFGVTAISGGGSSGGGGSYSDPANFVQGGGAGPYYEGHAARKGTSSLYYAFYNQGISYFYPDIKFGAGGGGGGSYGTSTYGGESWNGADGGNTGGGRGGNPGAAGVNGASHYGAGGGGGGVNLSTVANGGIGGTGIIILHATDFEEWAT